MSGTKKKPKKLRVANPNTNRTGFNEWRKWNRKKVGTSALIAFIVVLLLNAAPTSTATFGYMMITVISIFIIIFIILLSIGIKLEYKRRNKTK